MARQRVTNFTGVYIPDDEIRVPGTRDNDTFVKNCDCHAGHVVGVAHENLGMRVSLAINELTS